MPSRLEHLRDLSWVGDALAAEAPPRGPVVFVGGSAARGWANAGSDVDLYVLGGPQDCAWRIEARGARPAVDVHEVCADAVEALLGRMSWESLRAGFDYANVVTAGQWVMLERMLHPWTVAGAPELARLQERLRASAHRHMLVQTHFTFADSLVEDCVGQLDVGDDDSAVLSAHAGYLRAVDGLLAAHGCCSSTPKWRARAMQDTAPPLLPYEEFWAVCTMRGLADAGARAWAADTARRARDLVCRVDVLTFEVVR